MKLVRLTISVYFQFLKGLIAFLFRKKNRKACAVDSFANQFSFRAPLNLNFIHFTLKQLKDTIKKIWRKSKNESVILMSADSKNAVIEPSPKYKKLVTEDYLGEILSIKFNMVLIYDQVHYSGSFLNKLFLSFVAITLFPIFLFISLFFKNKKSFLFSFLELMEIIIVTDLFIKSDVNNVYTFMAYEKSSNFLAIIFNLNGISLTKICSPNPISIYYKKVVANTFILTAPYQLEEYATLKDNWYVDKVELWPVHDFKKYKQKYLSTIDKDLQSNIIGFYSSAFARRNQMGHNTLDLQYSRAETKLIVQLNKFLHKHTQYQLKIYPHPTEKSSDTEFKKTKEYYLSLFNGTADRVLFPEPGENTWETFDSIDVSLSVSSTINFERLFCGYKSLFAQLDFDKSSFGKTKMKAITILNEDKFDESLLYYLNISKKEFFVQHQINDYIFYGNEKDKFTLKEKAQIITCKRCIMSSDNDPDLVLNDEGICNHCVNFDEAAKKYPSNTTDAATKFDELIAEIKKRGEGKKYDAVLGVSGGVDSTYLAWLCKERGLRILLMHCDNGWNSELAVNNISNLIKATGFELYTYVLDWESFKDLQLAFIKSGVVDIELPYDYALYILLFKLAKQNKIPSVLSGHNLVTEGTYMPKSWVHDKIDIGNILDIHKTHGTMELTKYPNMWVAKYLYYQKTGFLKSFQLLNYTVYNKEDVKNFITEKLNWRDYGGKHYESVFTRFYQGYILPRRFKIDKRQYHLSTLIQSGQISREKALQEFAKPNYDPKQLETDYDFVLKKLQVSKEEFENYMDAPIKKHTDYKNIKTFWRRYFKLIRITKQIFFIRK